MNRSLSSPDRVDYDAVIIGGGFYGCSLALYLHQNNKQVAIVERESDILLRASYINQARVHNGYHYPRSFMTAWRSFINFPRFTSNFRECIDSSFDKIYAIARRNSHVNANQFKRFCQNLGAPIQQAPRSVRRLFNNQLIEEIFLVEELVFNVTKLRDMTRERLNAAGIPVALNTSVESVSRHAQHDLAVQMDGGQRLFARQVFNCTYAQINTVLHDSSLKLLPFRNELTEVALIRVPSALRSLGITVMDGPFFSLLPFPADGLHSLSHVRYTPHESWIDLRDGYRNAYEYLESRNVRSNFPYMLRDASRYIPILAEAEHVRSMYEIKTVLVRNEKDDGRPILVKEDDHLKNFFSIMGGKIDNIYDMLAHMDALVAVQPG